MASMLKVVCALLIAELVSARSAATNESVPIVLWHGMGMNLLLTHCFMILWQRATFVG